MPTFAQETFSKCRPGWFVFLAAISTVILLYVRAPDAFTSPQFWAEDGTIFWRYQYLYGWRAIFFAYAGYLHITQRLIAFAASWFDPAYAPNIFNYAAIAIAAWSSATAALAAEKRWLGFMLGATLAAVPHNGEVFANATNLQWLMAPSFALLLASKPSKGATKANGLVFGLLSGLSGPFSSFLLPLSAWRFYKFGDALSLVAMACGVVQVGVFITTREPLLAPQSVIGLLSAGSTIVFAWPGTWLGCAVVALSLMPSRYRTMRIGLLVLSAGATAGVLIRFPVDLSWVRANGFGRYSYVQQVSLLWCTISLMASMTLIAPLAAAWLAIAVVYYPLTMIRRPPLADTQWSEQIRDLGKRRLMLYVHPSSEFRFNVPPQWRRPVVSKFGPVRTVSPDTIAPQLQGGEDTGATAPFSRE